MATAPRVLHSSSAVGRPHGRLAPFPGCVLLVVAAWVLVNVAAAGPARAEGAGGERPSRRAGWATLLVAYTAVGAVVTGAAYLTRDNFAGRAIAGAAGAWGGGSVGAGAAYALTHLSPCQRLDCEEDRAGPVFLGALLGGVAGSLIASWQTSTPGQSRPAATALGMTPFFCYATLGTIFDW